MSGRLKRVNQLLKEEISQIIQKELDNPSIGFVTVTKVDINHDLSIAKVYISVMEKNERKQDTLKALNNASSYIKKLLGARIKLRYMPEVKFFEDKSIDEGLKLQRLFRKIDTERNEKNES